MPELSGKQRSLPALRKATGSHFQAWGVWAPCPGDAGRSEGGNGLAQPACSPQARSPTWAASSSPLHLVATGDTDSSAGQSVRGHGGSQASVRLLHPMADSSPEEQKQQRRLAPLRGHCGRDLRQWTSWTGRVSVNCEAKETPAWVSGRRK